MDHQKFSGINDKTLEKLFDLIIKNDNCSIQQLSEQLSTTEDIIRHMVSKLDAMGLALDIDDKTIKRLNDVDKINEKYIIEQCKKHNINKNIHYHFLTTSTNQNARESSDASIHIAEYQSAGRGRLARKWITPVGQSIALSISHDFNVGLNQLSGLNIAIGVAIIETIQHYDGKDFQLKWPNDVIGDKGKAAGILIEASGNSEKCRVIIGVGINWQVRTALLKTIEQACMNITPNHCDRNTFIFNLINNIEKRLNTFTQSQLKDIAPIWHKNDAFIGKYVNVINNNDTKKALYLGINEDGMLRVEVDQQIKLLASGEVSIRNID